MFLEFLLCFYFVIAKVPPIIFDFKLQMIHGPSKPHINFPNYNPVPSKTPILSPDNDLQHPKKLEHPGTSTPVI
jgi:hypothetical protein